MAPQIKADEIYYWDGSAWQELDPSEVERIPFMVDVNPEAGVFLAGDCRRYPCER